MSRAIHVTRQICKQGSPQDSSHICQEAFDGLRQGTVLSAVAQLCNMEKIIMAYLAGLFSRPNVWSAWIVMKYSINTVNAKHYYVETSKRLLCYKQRLFSFPLGNLAGSLAVRMGGVPTTLHYHLIAFKFTVKKWYKYEVLLLVYFIYGKFTDLVNVPACVKMAIHQLIFSPQIRQGMILTRVVSVYLIFSKTNNFPNQILKCWLMSDKMTGGMVCSFS